MSDEETNNDEQLRELEQLRRRIAELEARQAEWERREHELKRQRDKLSAYARIIDATLSTFKIDERLQTILHEVLSFLQAESGGIYLVQGDQLVLRAWKGLSDRLRSSLLSFAVAGVPTWARDSYIWHAGSGGDETFLELVQRERIGAWASVPLYVPEAKSMTEGEWVGTLFVADRRPAALSDDDLTVLTHMACQLALAIDHARAYHQARERLIRLETLHDIDRAIIQRLELKGILQVVLERVPAGLGADAVAVTLLDGPGNRPYVFVMRLPNGTIVEEEAFSLAESLFHWLVERQEPVIIYNLAEDPRLQMHRSRIRNNVLSSYLGVPLVVQDRAIGILHILSRSPKVFAEEEIDFFKTMAGQAAIAIANARLLDSAQRQGEELKKRVRELELAEQELQKSHGRLMEAQRLAGLGNWEWDIPQNELHWSEEIYRIFGVLPENFRGTHEAFLESVHPDDRERVKRSIAEAWSEHKPYRIEHRVVWPNGTVRQVHERGEVFYDERGVPVRMIGTVQDITDLRRLERSLRESEERFRSVVEFCPVGIMILMEGKIVYQNPEQKKILNLVQRSLTLDELFRLVYPKDHDKMVRFFDQVLTAQDGASEAEIRFFRYANGARERRLLWCHCRATSMIYHGRPAVLVTMTEVTEQKELERLVLSHEKMASLGQVAAGIAHEIRNPLSGINVFLDAIKENLDVPTGMNEIAVLVDEARSAARKIENVIRRVLDFSRHTAPRMQPGDLNDSIRSALDLARTTLRKAGIKLDIHYAADLPRIYLDGQLMEQVMLNLISNALDALRDFDGPKHLSVSSYAEGDWVGFRVCDSGPGIPAEDRERIFEPFYSRKKGGTGLGLSLCRRIVADHGGSIHLRRSPAKETIVEVRLPLDKGLKPK